MRSHTDLDTMNTVKYLSPRKEENEPCCTSTMKHFSSHSTVATYNDSMTSSLLGSSHSTFDEILVEAINDCESATTTRPLSDFPVDCCEQDEDVDIVVPLNDAGDDDDENDYPSGQNKIRRRRRGLLQDKKTWNADQRELLLDFGCTNDDEDDDAEDLAAYEAALLQMYTEHLAAAVRAKTAKRTGAVAPEQ